MWLDIYEWTIWETGILIHMMNLVFRFTKTK